MLESHSIEDLDNDRMQMPEIVMQAKELYKPSKKKNKTCYVKDVSLELIEDYIHKVIREESSTDVSKETLDDSSSGLREDKNKKDLFKIIEEHENCDSKGEEALDELEDKEGGNSADKDIEID